MKYQKFFKKRSNLSPFNRFTLGKQQTSTTNKILPLRIFKYIRKFLRKYFFKKKIKIIFNIHYNYTISYKGKNPRMGKGTGFFIRQAFLLKINQPFFTSTNASPLRKTFLKNLLKKKFNLQLL